MLKVTAICITQAILIQCEHTLSQAFQSRVFIQLSQPNASLYHSHIHEQSLGAWESVHPNCLRSPVALEVLIQSSQLLHSK